jgi:glycosyltransferase involved in cell wall biosynthesis
MSLFKGAKEIRYSIVIPTYKRPDVLEQCLESIATLSYPMEKIEVIVVDNGEEDHAAQISDRFANRMNIRHFVNERNLGPGGSLNKGLALSKGDLVAISNDDVILPPEVLRRADMVFADTSIGCLGFRAIENGYHDDGGGIGEISLVGNVSGNFSRMTDEIVDVEHIYGFFYVVSRQSLDATGLFDTVLLAKPYASGNRIETDQCLSIRQSGYRVVYDGTVGIIHQAKPRLDIAERSLKWRLNDIRNTAYLFLKHYGFAGKKFLATRYWLLHDLGIISLIKQPTRYNFDYFMVGLRGRLSALWHWAQFCLLGNKKISQREGEAQ